MQARREQAEVALPTAAAQEVPFSEDSAEATSMPATPVSVHDEFVNVVAEDALQIEEEKEQQQEEEEDLPVLVDNEEVDPVVADETHLVRRRDSSARRESSTQQPETSARRESTGTRRKSSSSREWMESHKTSKDDEE